MAVSKVLNTTNFYIEVESGTDKNGRTNAWINFAIILFPLYDKIIEKEGDY